MRFLLLLGLVAAAAARPDQNHYDSKYDNFNVDELTENRALMCSYGHCFIGDGKCTPAGKDIRNMYEHFGHASHQPSAQIDFLKGGWMDEGIETSCGKCTDKQKTLVAKFIKGLQVVCPEEWEALHKRGDPEGKHNDELKKFLEEYGH